MSCSVDQINGNLYGSRFFLFHKAKQLKTYDAVSWLLAIKTETSFVVVDVTFTIRSSRYDICTFCLYFSTAIHVVLYIQKY